MPTQNNDNLIDASINEIKAMGKQGMNHPSTRPVLTGGVIGAAAGLVLPIISWPLGLLAGAGIALYSRVRP